MLTIYTRLKTIDLSVNVRTVVVWLFVSCYEIFFVPPVGVVHIYICVCVCLTGGHAAE